MTIEQDNADERQVRIDRMIAEFREPSAGGGPAPNVRQSSVPAISPQTRLLGNYRATVA